MGFELYSIIQAIFSSSLGSNSLENHTLFQSIMSKIYTRFQTKTAQKPYPLGLHIPI